MHHLEEQQCNKMENPWLVRPKIFLQPHNTFSCSFWKINLSQWWFQKKAFCYWICLSTAKKVSWGPCKRPVWLRKVLSKTSGEDTEIRLHLLRDCVNANTRNWAKALYVWTRDHFPGKTSRSTKSLRWNKAFLNLKVHEVPTKIQWKFLKNEHQSFCSGTTL